MEKVSKRLNEALYKRNMKPVELSEKTGINKASISQYCSGHVEPKQDRIDIISKALSINPAWLSGFDVPMEDTTTLNYGGNQNNPTDHPTDEFTYAMYEEGKELTEDEKRAVRLYAKMLIEDRKKSK